MRAILVCCAIISGTTAANAEDVVSPLSLHPDLFATFRVIVEQTENTAFTVNATQTDAIDGLDPVWIGTRYTTYARAMRTPLIMDGVNDVMSRAAQTFCTTLFGADHFAEPMHAMPSAINDSFHAAGDCLQGPM